MNTLHRAWDRAQQRGEQRRRRMARQLPRWRTRARRRTLVVTWLLIPLVMIVMSVALSWTHVYMAMVFLAVLASWYPFWLVLRVLTTASAEAVAACLDERERAVRNKLGYVAFNVLITANMLIVFYISANDGDPIIGVRIMFLLVSCVLLSVSVPTALLAWRMPDDDPEDLDDPASPEAPAARTSSTTTPDTPGGTLA